MQRRTDKQRLKYGYYVQLQNSLDQDIMFLLMHVKTPFFATL